MGQVICKAVNVTINKVVDVSNVIYTKTHEVLDYVSYHVCPSRPSYKLATDNLHIPLEDASLMAQIFEIIKKTLGIVIIPFEALNDKKFCVHIYETSNVFLTPGNQQAQYIVNTCDKMFMYIAQNKSCIVEPEEKQTRKDVNINQIDYNMPVNFWYTFKISSTEKVYFFAHSSVKSNYRGIVIASNNTTTESKYLEKIKDAALNFYNQAAGKQPAVVSPSPVPPAGTPPGSPAGKKMDFI